MSADWFAHLPICAGFAVYVARPPASFIVDLGDIGRRASSDYIPS
jgi:hypothetical protein